ncbi:putative transcriptional regulator [Herbaspirillum sp. CF444]|uniref:helix-turn-helix transcriptional regulator n=1 Tax=Herbaspirillum sp. CF444 TaxID=1144319 RepID=UPI0002727936|nr:metalloregulator ArsR/SmtB family transcription factor [Herbaspirillum sp. CF444]EJL87915.1 putative transcriptional regulator [Herbaspirillum sp. CF444]
MKYTSKNLENIDAMPTAERILFRLKTKGPASTALLAQELTMTAEAARLQVQKLLADGLIVGAQEVSSGAGRPKQNWELSAAGHARFPDSHAYLTVQLIGSIRQLFGDEGLDRLIAQREDEMRNDYVRACRGMNGIPKRLEKLAALRTAEGYMARVEKQGKDWLLIEDHCPICAAAQSCQGFCRSELQLFREAIGDEASVTREEHLLAGARRCVYRIHTPG